MTDPKTEALAIWLAQQQQSSHLAQQQAKPGDLHLHQHHHPATPPPPAEFERGSGRMHPLFVASYLLFVSVAVSVPLALLAAIVDASNRPDVHYIQPDRGAW